MNELKDIQIVKIQGQCYLLNNTLIVPKADGNKEYELLKVWLETNIPEPEFTEEELQITSINKQIQEAKTYLASTDFYMTVDKYAELSEARKVELTTKRAEARELINTLEDELEIIGAK